MLALRTASLAAAASLCLAVPAEAALVVSTAPTRNVTCTAGVCTATAPAAVLNVSALSAAIAAGSVTLKSTSQAQDIVFAAPFSWASVNTLTLDAYRSIQVRQSFLDAGLAALTLVTNDGGTDGALSFGKNGHIAFLGTTNVLTIDGRAYRLANTLSNLAADIAVRPKGAFALSRSYNAGQDHAYAHAPIATAFNGTFEGLGNIVSNLSIYDTTDTAVGFFSEIDNKGAVSNLHLTNVNILSEDTFYQVVGALAGINSGTISQCSATGQVRSDFWVTIGGLIGENDAGLIERSFANVEVSGAQGAEAGGLAGNAHGVLSDDYAIGKVIAGDKSQIGGLVGYAVGVTVTRSYATGHVSGGQNASVGGLIGENEDKDGQVTQSYWNLTTSTSALGSGYGPQSGIRGLTTEQFTAKLPGGLSNKFWDQKPAINEGLPFLQANPPRKH